jgi:hypothetical protein
MNQSDYDRILGLARGQGKSDLIRLLRLFRANGFSKDEVGYGLIYLAQGLAENTLSTLEITNALRAGGIERKRGALAECQPPPPPKDDRTHR